MLRRTGPGLIALVVAFACSACACKGHPQGPGSGSAVGSGSGSAGAAQACEADRAHVRALYQAEARANPAAAKDATFVADNVSMVMGDCARDPGRVAACAAGAASVAVLEKDCLIPLDDEGTEGERLEP
jgi:hypothetical protein